MSCLERDIHYTEIDVAYLKFNTNAEFDLHA